MYVMTRGFKIIVLFIFNVLRKTEEGEICYDFLEEQQKITPQNNGGNGDYFGNSVSISDNFLAVGCKFDQESGVNTGAVYIYKLIDEKWVHDTKLFPSSSGGYQEFGYSVALGENTLVVGSHRDTVVAGRDTGSVYIFEHRNGSWIERQVLAPSDRRKGGRFGQHVAISGTTLVVNCNYGSSLAYVFEKIDQSWREIQKLQIAKPEQEQFDHPVAIYGDRIIVGRYYDSEKGHQSGSAIIFKKVAGEWLEEETLYPADGSFASWFGVSVAISDNVVVVSSHGDNAKGDKSGAAYVFEYDGFHWIEAAKLTPKRGKAGDSFGYPVTINNNKIAIGCLGDDSAGPAGHNSGAVHIFRNTGRGGNWTEEYKLLPSDGRYNGRFGYSIAISDKYTSVGSVKFDSFEGAVYTFENIDSRRNHTDLFCQVDAPREIINHFIWILAVSVPLALILCCVVFVCVCRKVREPKLLLDEKGEDEAEFIYHDVTKSEVLSEA